MDLSACENDLPQIFTYIVDMKFVGVNEKTAIIHMIIQ